MTAEAESAAETPLILAVPSKGRLQENAAAFFARSGLEFVQGRGARDYRGAIADLPGVEVAYLSASEIVGQLAVGAAHFGVTGEDLVRERIADADERLALLAPVEQAFDGNMFDFIINSCMKGDNGPGRC